MYLIISRGTSRGRDTYGYNIITATDENGKKFRTCGGGYDMLGTVIAEVINYHYQDRLKRIHKRAENYTKNGKYYSRREKGRCSPDYKKHSYGVTARYGKNQKEVKNVTIDGATGFSNVQGIAARLGLEVNSIYDRSKRYPKIISVEIIERRK